MKLQWNKSALSLFFSQRAPRARTEPQLRGFLPSEEPRGGAGWRRTGVRGGTGGRGGGALWGDTWGWGGEGGVANRSTAGVGQRAGQAGPHRGGKITLQLLETSEPEPGLGLRVTPVLHRPLQCLHLLPSTMSSPGLCLHSHDMKFMVPQWDHRQPPPMLLQCSTLLKVEPEPACDVLGRSSCTEEESEL